MINYIFLTQTKNENNHDKYKIHIIKLIYIYKYFNEQVSFEKETLLANTIYCC